MAADKKALTEKESAKKIKDLKIELLKNPTKRGSIKKEIARMLTMAQNQCVPVKGTNQTKPEDKK